MTTEETISQLATSSEATHAMKRIVVVGTSGSGKTTLARQLASILDITAVELDALHWEANWTPASPSVLRERVDAALNGEGWVVDGNYSKLRDLTWGRADTVVWLDYSLWVVMTRVIRRTFIRAFRKVELWNGNRERLSNAVFSKDSILLWALQTHGKNRRAYTRLINQNEYAHLNVVRLNLPGATRLWLENLQKKG